MEKLGKGGVSKEGGVRSKLGVEGRKEEKEGRDLQGARNRKGRRVTKKEKCMGQVSAATAVGNSMGPAQACFGVRGALSSRPTSPPTAMAPQPRVAICNYPEDRGAAFALCPWQCIAKYLPPTVWLAAGSTRPPGHGPTAAWHPMSRSSDHYPNISSRYRILSLS